MTTKPTCYLHLGLGKTGSSAIQYTLTKAHDYLLSCGFLYPDISDNFDRVLKHKTTGGNASKLRRSLKNKGHKHVVQLLEPFSCQSENLVLSCEGLSELPLESLRELARGLILLGYDIKCLVFFRPQAESLVSRYLQKTKGNKTDNHSLDEYVNRMLSPDKFDQRWNWHIRAQNFSKAFGAENVMVQWYPSVTQRESPGVVNTVMHWMGTTLPDDFLDTHEKIINPTPGREALIILERLNSLGWGNKRFSETFLVKAHRQGIIGSKVVLNPSLMKKVDIVTRDSNTKLLEQYFPKLSAEDELDIFKNYQHSVSIDTNIIDKLECIALHMFRKSISGV